MVGVYCSSQDLAAARHDKSGALYYDRSMRSFLRVSSRKFPAAVLFTALLAAGTGAAWAKKATYIRPVIQSFPAAGIQSVVIENLDGPVTVRTAQTQAIKVEILIHAAGADKTFARTLTRQLIFKPHVVVSQLRIVGHYPTRQFRNYGYPYMKAFLGFFHGTDTNQYLGQTIHVRAKGNSKSIVLWAHIRISLPPDVTIYVRNIYGNLTARCYGPAGKGLFDAFTSAGNILVYDPKWAHLNLQSDYGAVKFPRGLGVINDAKIDTHFGGTYLYLQPGATGKIYARKSLGFLHNSFTKAHFSNQHGEHVMVLGDGHGPIVHIKMKVGSLHLERGAGQ